MVGKLITSTATHLEHITVCLKYQMLLFLLKALLLVT